MKWVRSLLRPGRTVKTLLKVKRSDNRVYDRRFDCFLAAVLKLNRKRNASSEGGILVEEWFDGWNSRYARKPGLFSSDGVREAKMLPRLGRFAGASRLFSITDGPGTLNTAALIQARLQTNPIRTFLQVMSRSIASIALPESSFSTIITYAEKEGTQFRQRSLSNPDILYSRAHQPLTRV